MRKFVLFLFISCLSLSLIKAHSVTENNFLTVSATSGLSLRFEPGQSADIISVIPFGATVEVIERCEDDLVETIEWTKGTWVYVHYNNRKGYVFDGYLTALPLPEFEFEQVISDMDLIYPLSSWAEHRFNEVTKVDTIIKKDMTKIIKVLAEGVILKEYEDDFVFKTELELDKVRLMDAYHLLLNMMDKYERATFQNKTIFITDENYELSKIKVNLDSPVNISKIDENRIRITINNYEKECRLL